MLVYVALEKAALLCSFRLFSWVFIIRKNAYGLREIDRRCWLTECFCSRFPDKGGERDEGETEM